MVYARFVGDIVTFRTPLRNSEAILMRLHRLFVKVSPREPRPRRLPQVIGKTIRAGFLFGSAALIFWYFFSSPFEVVKQAQHLLAAPDCAAARAVGLAPARRGQPGYWPSHDADNDGIACEPYPR